MDSKFSNFVPEENKNPNCALAAFIGSDSETARCGTNDELNGI